MDFKGENKMSLYKDWADMVVEYVKVKGEDAFWEEYGAVQKSIYGSLLRSNVHKLKGTISEFANRFGVSNVFFMGFLDSANSSLAEPLNLEDIAEDDEIEINIDFEKLYINMLESGTEYLYELPQWEAALSNEKRRHLRARYKGMIPRKSNKKTGRNDPCPCGSGLKYKNCCGKK